MRREGALAGDAIRPLRQMKEKAAAMGGHEERLF